MRTNRRGPRQQHRPRRAVVTVAVLVCLLLITLIAASLLRMVHSQRALIRVEERGVQAEWLAESGLERASMRLEEDSGYHGETWSIPAESIGGSDTGVVTILVEPGRESSRRRLVTVHADYPIEPVQRVRRSKQSVVDLAPVPAGATP